MALGAIMRRLYSDCAAIERQDELVVGGAGEELRGSFAASVVEDDGRKMQQRDNQTLTMAGYAVPGMAHKVSFSTLKF